MWRFAPAAKWLHWVPRSFAPWGEGLGTNAEQRSTSNRKMCRMGRSATFLADGSHDEFLITYAEKYAEKYADKYAESYPLEMTACTHLDHVLVTR